MSVEDFFANIWTRRLTALETGDFGMFSDEGNKRVAGIVNEAISKFESPSSRFDYALGKLGLLGKNPKYVEATDTEVREIVWQTLKRG